jgi:small-conductance mechanosensitive channel
MPTTSAATLAWPTANPCPRARHADGTVVPVLSALPEFIEEHFDVLVVKPARILLIVLVAIIARALINRAISRLTRTTVESELPTVLRPLKERVAGSTQFEGSGVLSERRRQRAETIGSVLRSITTFVVFGLAVVLILGELEFNLAPLIAGAGIIGVAAGFGAQNLVKDLLAGIFIILEDQFGVGDVIDVTEVSGAVEAVGLRSTRLRDIDGTVWYVRNGEIIKVGNKSQGYAQVVLDLPLPLTTDIDAVGRAMKNVADDLRQDDDWTDAVIEEPQMLGVERIGEEGVVLRLTVKTRPLEQWRVGRELRRRLKERLDAEGIALA